MTGITNCLLLIGVSMLVGVLVIDLVFDLYPDKSATITYYSTHRSSKHPIGLSVPLVIVGCLVLPLLYRIFKLRLIYDILLFVFILLPGVYFYLGILTPDQEKLVGKTKNDAEALGLLENIKFFHLVMISLMMAGYGFIFMNILSESSTKKPTAPTTKKTTTPPTQKSSKKTT